MKPLSLKEKAILYRKRGYSYSMISEKLGLAKSTLSGWLRQIDFIPNQEVLSRINSARKKLRKLGFIKHQTAIKLRNEIRRKSREEIKNLSKKDLWYIGAILYLGEGNKSQGDVRLSNSDPRVIKLFIRWLKIICGVKPGDIQAWVHIYPDNDAKEAICYWSKITKIPESQFQKIQVDRRIKKSKIKLKRLPYGTLHLRVKRGGNLFQKIAGWTEGILEKLP